VFDRFHFEDDIIYVELLIKECINYRKTDPTKCSLSIGSLEKHKEISQLQGRFFFRQTGQGDKSIQNQPGQARKERDIASGKKALVELDGWAPNLSTRTVIRIWENHNLWIYVYGSFLSV